MKKECLLKLAAVLFVLISVGHLVRFLAGWPARVGPFSVPIGASLVAAVVFAVLAFLYFRAGRQDCCGS